MLNELIETSNPQKEKCDCCGAVALHSELKTEYFNYKSEGGELVKLSALVPVWSCDACGDSFTDFRAEDLRHEAVCRYLGRLTPSDLRDLRENCQCSQAEWASLTGLGIASIKRWETGALIQSLSNDRYLRLLHNRQTFRDLVSLARSESPSMADLSLGTFRTEISATTFRRASTFQLRPSVPVEV